ncbi:MAG: extracellular solute-binding protein [Bacteroidales bacterium]
MQKTVFLLVMLLFLGCAGNREKQDNGNNVLHIIHAGSLTYPVQQMTEAFSQEYPEVRIRTEAWGSKAGARRVIELDNPADLFLSADYLVIENMLIPDHASWYIPFAANEMAIVYTGSSRHAGEINRDNWHEILRRPDVNSGRANPDQDPCGVRTVFTAKLAEMYYHEEGLADDLLTRAGQHMRPKETDLIALLESGHLDYIFLYRSVAIQHELQYITLPPELSLGDPELDEWYARVSTETLGTAPGHTITEKGQSMVYGLTIPHKVGNPEMAEKFAAFVLDKEKGQRILEASGQPPLSPGKTPYYEQLPEELKDFAGSTRQQ